MQNKKKRIKTILINAMHHEMLLLQRANIKNVFNMYVYTYMYRMYICIMTHIWLKMKIAYTKMVFRER